MMACTVSLKVADTLQNEGISARVIDGYSVKPIDTATLAAAAAATDGRIVVVEDRHPEGGLGSAVIDALIDSGASDLRIARLAARHAQLGQEISGGDVTA
jgi:transketolase